MIHQGIDRIQETNKGWWGPWDEQEWGAVSISVLTGPKEGWLSDSRESCSHGRGTTRWSWSYRRETQPLPNIA